MRQRWILVASLLSIVPACRVGAQATGQRPRSRDVGLVVGDGRPGEHNAITDVAGVRVGHLTLSQGDSIRTGLTAIVPHGGDLFDDKVPAAFVCFNGFGKPFGTVQIDELGEIETPILLGSTLSVPRIADGILDHVLAGDTGGTIHSINPVVGETNDGYLSDGRARPIRAEHVAKAIEAATSGAVEEGSVGAGTGTRCLGFKGGIGTSSRRVPISREGRSTFLVGVLVQTNFGGELRIDGRKISAAPPDAGREHGSCAIVVATDAPLSPRQLKRLARRSFVGMARTGASFSHGSGDYAFAFTTARRSRTANEAPTPLPDRELTPLLGAVADATQEAIYNSLLRARTVRGRAGHVAHAIDPSRVKEALGRARAGGD